MNQAELFDMEIRESIHSMSNDCALKDLATQFHNRIVQYNYAYNFKWLGRPIIQEPTDIVALQEIIWKTKPDLIIDCGIAHGGSLILNASMLAMLDIEDAITRCETINPKESKRKVIGIDIDIRAHNRSAIEAHPMMSWIQMIEGSSIEESTIDRVIRAADRYHKIMVCLDSNHTHAHVLAELKAYAPLVSVGCYCVVFDTGVEDLPEGSCTNKPWGKGNNPKTAVWEYLKVHKQFEIDKEIESKLLLTADPDGYLKRIR
jgi:cephalosporin hydroxylase